MTTMTTMTTTTAKRKTNRLRLLVTIGADDPRVFDLAVGRLRPEMRSAVDAGADAFGAAFNAALKVSRRAPARRAVKKRKSATPLTNP